MSEWIRSVNVQSVRTSIHLSPRGCVRLTLRKAVPHLQPVVLAVALAHHEGIVLQVECEEGEGDVHVGRSHDHVGALQIVRVFVREAWGLDHAGRAGEVAEAEFRP